MEKFFFQQSIFLFYYVTARMSYDWLRTAAANGQNRWADPPSVDERIARFAQKPDSIIKLAIHYLQTWRIGDEIIFSQIKYCWRKRGERVAVHYPLLRDRRFFFDKKILCVCRRDCYPDANPAYSVWLRNMANAFYTLFAVHRFFVISPLFRCCLRIVYSGL